MKKDFISVLLPVYNAEEFLSETLSSILNQTYKDFEIIAINDGSTDTSLQILKDAAKNEPRLLIIDQENIGLVATLNKAAETARGEFIARMDADDLSLPRRFEIQLAEFHKNPSIILVAGTFEVIDEDGEFLYRESVPTEDEDIKRAMYVRNPIAHGSVMFRKSTFDEMGGYSDTCGPTEDYELWSRMAQVGKFSSVEQVVFKWRINPAGITHTKTKTMEDYMTKNIERYWSHSNPVLLTPPVLRKKLKFYKKNRSKHGLAMYYKILFDSSQIGTKLVGKGYVLRGFRQILCVALSGRTGMRITIKRLSLILMIIIKRRAMTVQPPHDKL